MDVAPIPATKAPGLAMEALLAPYRAEVAKLALPFATATDTLPFETRDDGILGSWVADVMLEEARRITGRDVQASFMNSGGIRKTIDAGPISYRDLGEVLPFDNTLVLIELTSEETLELARFFADRRGSFPIANMTIEATAEKEVISATIAGEPVVPNRTYMFVTNNFLAAGGNGMGFLKDKPMEDTGVLLRDAAVSYVKRLNADGKGITAPENPHRYRFGGKTVEELE